MKTFSKIIILVFTVIFIASCKTDSLPNNLSFDSAKWKSGDTRTRGRMAQDLQRSSILRDKTKAEVVEILGKPDNADKSNDWSYEVDLGGTKNALISKIRLVVMFNEKTEKSIGAIFTGGQLFGIYMIIPPNVEMLTK